VHLGRLLPVGHPPLCVEVAGDDERSQAVTRRFGGVEYQRSLSLELDLTGDAWRFASLAPERAGVTVQSMRPDATEEQWQAAFAVYASASLDLPDRAGAPAPSYDMFRAQTDHSPGVHLAWRDGSPVGISGAGLDGPGAWYVFFTGTLASERRTGVARALKNALHRTAHGEGVRTLATSTLSNNTPMLTLNAALGYRITGAVARFAIG
jgi:GNAT superfamily N-acetyltransferase